MFIEPIYIRSYKQHNLPDSLTVADIKSRLPGIKSRPSSDGKCKYQWEFFADGQECSIWDFNGARWSAFGPREVFVKLFGLGQ